MNQPSDNAGRPAYGIAPAGFRLPDATRLGPVRLQVADLARSLAYYCDLLGLRVLGSESETAVLGSQAEDVPLIELWQRWGAAPAPLRGRLGLFHFAVLLPSRADLGRFLRHVAEQGEQPGASDHLVSEALYLRDPDGLGIEVYADRPRAAWRTNGRELRMDTLPLDAQSLLREAGDRPWQGMPAGTTLGHVHLHVGDLDTAAGFYHQALGFDRMVWSYPGALFLGAGGYHHHLGINTWAGSRAEPPSDDEARLLEWTVELPDAERLGAAAASLAAAGYAAARTAEDEEVLARDPWGTAVRLRVARDRGG
jgi:catechol 2,3-dioxygenase